MKAWMSVVLLCLTVITADAVPLKIVPVSTNIYCAFDTDCNVVPTNFTEPFVLPGTTGRAILLSRLFPPGEKGSKAEGLYAYLYQIDLRKLTASTLRSCINALTMDFGPVAPLDYNGDGSPDHVFVITDNGPGNIALSTAVQVDDTITFRFKTPVCSGAVDAVGDSTFLFGLASARPHTAATVQIRDTLAATLTLDARAPDFIDVNCDHEQSLRAALQEVKSGATLRVTGTCKETITLPVDDFTLLGVTLLGEKRAVLLGSGESAPVLTISGRQNVVIKNVLVSAGLYGVLVLDSVNIVLEGVQAVRNIEDGFRIDAQSVVYFINCLASYNGGSGFVVLNGSIAFLQRETVSEYNKRNGLKLHSRARAILRPPDDAPPLTEAPETPLGGLKERGLSTEQGQETASARLLTSICPTTLVGNGVHGIYLSADSDFINGGCQIDSWANGGDGARIVNGSSFALYSGSRLISQDNTGNGLLFNASNSTIDDAQVTVTANQKGLELVEGAWVQIDNGSTVSTDGNSSYGIRVRISSELYVYNQSIVHSWNNTNHGLSLRSGSYVFCDSSTTLTLSGNNGRGVEYTTDSRLALSTCTITP